MSDEQTTHRLNTEGADLLTLAGVNDANLIELQRQTGTRVTLRGDTLTLVGTTEAVERAASVAQRMIDAAKQGTVLGADDVLRMSMDGSREPAGSGGDNRIVLPGVRKISVSSRRTTSSSASVRRERARRISPSRPPWMRSLESACAGSSSPGQPSKRARASGFFPATCRRRSTRISVRSTTRSRT